jgi:hypothetical protein
VVKRIFPILGLTVLVLAALGLTLPVQAQAGNAYDLIAAVNAYRAANGLAEYTIDGGLMSTAQGQSDYQASIQTCTHNRADGSSPGDHGVSAENIACGINLSVETAIYSQWSDPTHTATMLGPDTGLVGAGVATVGNKVYYTLDVKRLSGEFIYRQPKQPTQQTLLPGQSSSTPNPLITLAGPMVTATAHKDGSVVHIVRYGQTLVEIAKAYGVPLDALFAANGSLDPTSAAIYAGQALVIHPPYTVTPTPTITLTPRPPTRTLFPTRTVTPYRSPAPTATLSPTPFLQIPSMQDVGLDPKKVGYGVILVSLGGLALVLVKGFLKGKHQ